MISIKPMSCVLYFMPLHCGRVGHLVVRSTFNDTKVLVQFSTVSTGYVFEQDTLSALLQST